VSERGGRRLSERYWRWSLFVWLILTLLVADAMYFRFWF
jgi:hypothetical protein